MEKAKVIIINPKDDKHDLQDGLINYLGEINGDTPHEILMTNYGIDVYGNNTMFGIISEGNYLPNVPVYFLTEEYGNVVFLNISNSKIGKQGLLYLPSDISEKQIEAINTVCKQLKGFDIEVNNNMRIEDGLVESESITFKADGIKDIYEKKGKSNIQK